MRDKETREEIVVSGINGEGLEAEGLKGVGMGQGRGREKCRREQGSKVGG